MKQDKHKVPLTLSQRMSRIRKTGSKPELIVRRFAHRLGYRFRLYQRDLPGNPDLAFPSRRKVIFVHGCFWHRHDCLDGRKLPNSKPDYWAPKLTRNAERDQRNIEDLRSLGWDSLVLWECELTDPTELAEKLRNFLGAAGTGQGRVKRR